MKKRVNLIIEVKEIRGNCPVYKVGDKIVINQGYRLDLKKSKTENSVICTHSLSSFLPYLTALSSQINPQDLGLSKCCRKPAVAGGKDKKSFGYVQCLDPGEPYTPGGTVIFEIKTTFEKV